MSAVPEIHRHGWDLPVAGRATLDQEPRVAQDCSGPITSRRPAAEPGEESAVRCAASASSACLQAGVDPAIADLFLELSVTPYRADDHAARDRVDREHDRAA